MRVLKPALRDFQAYIPGQQPPHADWIKLNTNESPWPPSPRVVEAVREAACEDLRRYPDPLSRPAREALARHQRVEPTQVLLGNGADDVLELCFRAFAGAGDRVAFPDPTYSLFTPLCKIHEAQAAPHPLTAEWGLPAGFAGDDAPLKFLVSPNSPTGTWFQPDAVRDVVERSSGIVVLDEAYVDFAPHDCMGMVREGLRNLLVVRTFSKAYALAGMRLGYAVGPAELVAALDLVKDSYNVGRLACTAAIAAIEDQEYHDRLVAFVVKERDWLTERLRAAGWQVAPSQANFVFTRPPAGLQAESLASALAERRILVRHYRASSLADWLRITIGTREQHEQLLEALAGITL